MPQKRSVPLPFALALTLALAGLAPLARAAATDAPAPAADSAAAAPDTLAASADTLASATPPAPHDYVAEIRANYTPRSRAYAGVRAVLTFVEPLYGIAVAALLLFSGLSARMRDVAHAMGRARYVRVLVYLAEYLGVTFVLGFPLAWYQTFALEHEYGLSNQSFGAWLGEQGISILVALVLLGVVPMLALVYRDFEKHPRGWWLRLAIGTLPVIAAVILISPYLDALYNKFTPLRDAALRTEIVSLAERAGIPGRNVYEVDKSRQTKKYNAYVNGFGATQRIVLWDTTLEGMTKDEILFVMGHEMGHYVLRHIWKTILLLSALSFLLFWLAQRLTDLLVARWGPRWGFTATHDVASMPLLVAVLTVVLFVALPVINGYSRVLEHESDTFGLEVTRLNHAAAGAFIKLGSQNRSDPEPPAWRVWLLYSHPPLIERVRYVTSYRPWEEGRPNRVFKGEPYRRAAD